MSHQDAFAETAPTNSAYLGEALQWMLRGIRFDLKFRSECRWTPLWLVQAALFRAWSIETKLTERFACSQRLVQQLQGERKQNACSWQAFIELLSRHSRKLVKALKRAFQQRMQQEFPNSWLTFGFVVLGVDGSTIEVPLTKSHRDAFATSTSKAKSRHRTAVGDPGADKRSATPLITLTTLFHVALNLPWDWRTGSREQSEREQLRQMLAGLPAEALLCADAGFVGYDLLRSITGAEAQFIIRVGSKDKRGHPVFGARRRILGVPFCWVSPFGEAEPPRQCVPRQSLGTSGGREEIGGGLDRESQPFGKMWPTVGCPLFAADGYYGFGKSSSQYCGNIFRQVTQSCSHWGSHKSTRLGIPFMPNTWATFQDSPGSSYLPCPVGNSTSRWRKRCNCSPSANPGTKWSGE